MPDSVVESMKEAMRHRGPDDHGTHLDNDMVLGHRRLSIIDLAGGRQPMENEDGSVTVVTNGEIYNHESLRRHLQEKGHSFRTRSDTEVLVHLWEERGSRMVEDLVGMFAFAVWDGNRRTLFLARDRYGQKPLFYSEKNGQIIFASSLKALLAHPWVNPLLSKTAFSQYLLHEYVPAPLSIYEGVHKLDAGQALIWRRGKAETSRYWEYPLDREPFSGSPEECAEEILRLLDQSVRRRLMSDVPLGVFLSGGIDSSALVALMAKHLPAERIRTFTIGFREETFDESGFALSVARHFGTDHRAEILDEKLLVQILPEVIRAYDEPFSDASALPTYLLSRFTRRHVTVALGGDGGDELFAGYDAFAAHRIAGWMRPLPGPFHALLQRSAELLPPSDAHMNLPFLAKRFFRASMEEPVTRNHLWLGTFDHLAQKMLLTADFSKGLGDPIVRHAPDNRMFNPRHDLEAVTYDYIRTYLQEGILTKVDRASMIHSLEVRSPFLDHELGEFSSTIPFGWKLKGLEKKAILKRALKGLLPEPVLNRRKRGFGVPKARWLRTSLRPHLETCFSEGATRDLGVFSHHVVKRMMEAHFSRKEDHHKELWTLLMFELWRRENGGSFTP